MKVYKVWYNVYDDKEVWTRVKGIYLNKETAEKVRAEVKESNWNGEGHIEEIEVNEN